MFKEIFNEKEWQQLEVSIVWIFQAIAGIDKNIDKSELNAFLSIPNKIGKIDCDLLKELIKSFQFDKDTITYYQITDMEEIKRGLRHVAVLLDNKLEPAKSLLFKKSLLALGMYIAYASGDILSSKMSNIELQAIVELSLFMKISKAKYRENPLVEDIMEKLIS